MGIEKVRLSVVSYLNAKPFVFGLKQSTIVDSIDLELDPPALCAQKLIHGNADIGLVPVAVIPEIPNAEIISEFCISASGKVESVILVSQQPISLITKILLDNESRTSVILARVLADRYWKIEPEWKNEQVNDFDQIEGTTAAVIIGDRALQMRSNFKYIYDLSEEWMKMTGLPFVFACWVTNKKLSLDFVDSFNKALSFGVGHIGELAAIEKLSESKINYLVNSIQYRMDENKRKGLQLFLQLAESFHQVNSNGKNYPK